VTTDNAHVYRRVLDEHLPGALHVVDAFGSVGRRSLLITPLSWN
jgi:hypothetical protein